MEAVTERHVWSTQVAWPRRLIAIDFWAHIRFCRCIGRPRLLKLLSIHSLPPANRMEVRYEFDRWVVYVHDAVVFEHEDKNVVEEWMDRYELVSASASQTTP